MAADVAVALGAGAVEDDLARRFEGIQDRIGIGQRAGAGRHRVGEQLDARRRELRLLKGSEVVEEARWRVDGGRRMVLQRGERLVLQRVDAAVELVAAAPVRAAVGDRPDAVGAGDLDVEDRGNRAPDVGDGLAGRARRCRARNRRAAVEQLDVRGQRDRDPDQAVLRQVGEVVRGRAVDAKVVGVDRAKERIVDAGRGHLREPRLRGGRGQLEVLRIHVAVGTRAAVAAQAGERPVVEVRLAATDRGVDRRGRRRGAAVGVECRTVVAAATGGERDGAEQHKGRGPQALALDRFHGLPSGSAPSADRRHHNARSVLKVIRRALKHF